MGPIDSPQNAQVAAARRLLTRKGRAAAAAFLVEGPHSVGDALGASGHRVREVFITASTAEREVALVQAATAQAVLVRVVSERVLASLRDTVTPQGVVAVVETPTVSLTDVMTAGTRLAALLDQVADPGNAGTVIRTADAAGAGAVIVGEGSVDIWSGKCVRASAGSLFHVPVVDNVSVASAIEVARSVGCSLLATDAGGDVDLDDLIEDGTLSSSTVWLFGNEAHGVSSGARDNADRVVRVPVYGQAESLNLAATAAICLYASARAQRR